MLSEHDTKLLAETGAGTAMGDLFRRFWMPVLLSEEVSERNGVPVAVRILGEDLVAFRDSEGSVGLLEAYCPHRHAHMFWGRNEDCGLRCTYHGWKFNVDGVCVDMPNEPVATKFDDKIQMRSYPTREAGGCIWAYLGPPQLMPPELPQFEWLLVPDSHRLITKRLQLNNWAQALEGGIDSSHVAFLHGSLDNAAPVAAVTRTAEQDGSPLNETIAKLMRRDRPPHFFTSSREYGFMLAARRDAPDEQYYWRLTPFLLPSYTIIPGGAQTGGHVSGHAWVPLDDEHCWTFSVTWNAERPLTEEEREHHLQGYYIHTEVDKETPMWDLALSNAYLPIRNRGNNYLIDREEQRTQTYTGIKGISEQDMSIQESMGAISPRWTEHLGTTDTAIIEFRKLLLRLARDLREGKEPEAAQRAELYRLRSAAFLADRAVDWEAASAEHVKARV